MILNRLKALLLDNYLIKIVSLVFAVILWFYVNSRGGAEIEIAVPLELRNVPARLVVVGDMIDDVTVRVKGRERILQEIMSRPPRAVLDLTAAREGNNVLFLDPSAITVPANVQIARINPRRILVRMEPLLKKEVPVSGNVYGEPAPGYRIGRVEVVPGSVTVEGPRSVVDPLLRLVTEPIDVTGAQKTVVREVRLNLLGKEIQVEPQKPVLVKIHIRGQN
jgi:YbbR domain-containing protein